MSEGRNLQLYIDDVLEAIEKINGYVSGIADAKKLKEDAKTYDAVIRNFTIIGEAIRNIYEKVRENHPNVEWKEIMAMRNLLVHEYWGIDERVVWDAIKKDLPKLKGIITKVGDTLSN